MEKKKRKLLYTFLKIAVTILFLYIVFTKIPFAQVWKILKNGNITFLATALICFIASQWVSANRLLSLFRIVGYSLSPKSNYILYLTGMFYNFFIPGGIGGDAYKVYILNKEFKWSIKKLSATIFWDRFIGLTAIGILVIILCFFIPFFNENNLFYILFVLLILGILFSYLFTKFLFADFLSVFIKALLQSFLVQFLQIICLIAIISSITTITDYVIYILVFLVSSILSLFSFSGIGVREIIFYQSSILYSFDTTTAVSIGLIFSILTAIVSFSGIVFHIKKYKYHIIPF